MELWSNDFTAAFFVSFIVTVFAPDHIQAIQKNKYCEYVYELEQPVQWMQRARVVPIGMTWIVVNLSVGTTI